MSPYEQRVRELAYEIWESEGRPAGHEYRHWEMACKLVEMTGDSVGNNDKKNPLQIIPLSKTDSVPSGSSKKSTAKTPAKKSASKIKGQVATTFK